MTTTPSHPEWATVGASVVIAQAGATGVMYRTTIARLTPKSIVTERGTRFTASGFGWTARGDRSWGGSPTLLAADDPKAVAYFREQDRRAAAHDAEAALIAWRRDVATPETAAALRAALDALAPHLTDTED